MLYLGDLCYDVSFSFSFRFIVTVRRKLMGSYVTPLKASMFVYLLPMDGTVARVCLEFDILGVGSEAVVHLHHSCVRLLSLFCIPSAGE